MFSGGLARYYNPVIPSFAQSEPTTFAKCAHSAETAHMTTPAFTTALERELDTRGRGAKTRLSEALDVPASTLSGWVTGDRTPEPSTVFAIERALELDPGALSRHLGYLPLDAVDVHIVKAEDAIIADPGLSARAKRSALTVIEMDRDLQSDQP